MLKVEEPAADLAIAMAILSSFKNKAIDPNAAIFGEVELLGEVRNVGTADRRTKEARRLGFATVLSPQTIRNLGMKLTGWDSL